MANTRSAVSLADLPETTLALAYTYLPREDRCSLLHTCKAIREAALHLVSSLTLYTHSNASTAKSLDALAHYPRGAVLRRLSIINCSRGRNTGHWMPLLQAFQVHKLGDRLAAVDSVMLKGCSTPSISASDELGTVIFRSLFPALKYLSMDCCYWDDTSLLENLDSQKLRVLSLGRLCSFNTTAPTVPQLIGSQLPCLEHASLHLPVQPDIPPDVTPLAACKHLLTLDLSWSMSDPCGLPAVLGSCTKLSDLSLTSIIPLLDSAASTSLNQIHVTYIELGRCLTLSAPAFRTRFPQLQRIAVHCLVLAPPLTCPQDWSNSVLVTQGSAVGGHGEGTAPIETLVGQSARVLSELPIALESMSLSLVGPSGCADVDVEEEVQKRSESESALRALGPLSGTALASGLRRLMIDRAYFSAEAVRSLADVFPHVSVLVLTRSVAVADAAAMKAAIQSWYLTEAVFPLPHEARHDDVLSMCEEAQRRSPSRPPKLSFGFKTRQHASKFDPKGCEAKWCEAGLCLRGQCKVHLAFL